MHLPTCSFPSYSRSLISPHVASGYQRIGLICFLAGCHRRQLNQDLFVLCLILDLFWNAFACSPGSLWLYSAVMCFPVFCSGLVVNSNWLERLDMKMIYNVLIGTLNPYFKPLLTTPETDYMPSIIWHLKHSWRITANSLLGVSVSGTQVHQ